MKVIRHFLFIVILCFSFENHAQRIFWARDSPHNTISSANMDGSDIQVHVSGETAQPIKLALDASNGYLFVLTQSPNLAKRYNLSGFTLINTIQDWASFTAGLNLAPHPGEELLYYNGFVDSEEGKIEYNAYTDDESDDPTNYTTLNLGTYSDFEFHDIAIDTDSERVYVSNDATNRIYYVGTFGGATPISVVNSGADGAFDLYLGDRKVFYESGSTIRSADMDDGSGSATLISSGLTSITALNVNQTDGRMVILDGAGKILTANVDGSNLTQVISSTDMQDISLMACSTPTAQVSALSAAIASTTSLDLTWTNGSGDNVIVLAKEATAVDTPPTSGNLYSPSDNFGSGNEIGTGNYVVYSGAGSSVTVTGLTTGTEYHFAAYTFDAFGACYRRFTPPVTSATPMLQTHTSTAIGDWTDPSIWDTGVVPNPNDNVVIATAVTNDDPLDVTVTNFTITASGSYTASSSGELNILGDFINDGTYIPTTTSKVDFQGINHVIGGTSITTFNEIESDHTGIITLGNDIVINNALRLNTGTFDANGHQLDVTGGLDFSGASFIPSAGRVIFRSEDSGIANISMGGSQLFNLDIINGTSGSTRALSSFVVLNDLTMTDGTYTQEVGTLTFLGDYNNTGTTLFSINGGTGFQAFGSEVQLISGDLVIPNFIVNKSGNYIEIPAGNGDLIVTNSFSLDGDIRPNDNTVVLGNTSEISVTFNSGLIYGKISRYFDAGAPSTTGFPLGSSLGGVSCGFQINVATAGTLDLEFVETNLGTANLPFTDTDGSQIGFVSSEGYWDVSGTLTPSGSYNFTANVASLTETFTSTARMISGANGVWTDEGTIAGVAVDRRRDDMTTFPSYFIFGDIICEPTTQASGLTVSGITNTTVDLTWMAGDGDHSIILAKAGTVDSDPVDGTAYFTNPIFGDGGEIGTGNFVVYAGTGTSASITGLTQGTDYNFKLYTYNDAGPCYLTPTTAEINATPGPQVRTTIQDGDWTDPATWDIGVPQDGDDVVINHAVNDNTFGFTLNSITINATGSLNNGTSSVMIQGDIINNGSWDCSSGTTWIFEGTDHSVSGTFVNNPVTITFNHSGTVTLNQDIQPSVGLFGNSGILDANGFNITTVRNWRMSGTDFTPGTGTVSFSVASVENFEPSLASRFYNLDMTVTNNGQINCEALSILNNFTVNPGDNTGTVRLSNGFEIQGNLSLNGAYTFATGEPIFSGSNVQVVSGTQTLGAGGIITLNKTGGHVSLETDINSESLTLNNGIIVTNSNKVRLNQPPTVTTGYVEGKLEIRVDGSPQVFALGAGGSQYFIEFETGSIIYPIIEFIPSDPGTNGFPLEETGASISAPFTDGFWQVTIPTGIGSYSLRASTSSFVSPTDNNSRMVSRATPSDPWTLNGTHAAGDGTFVERTGLTGLTQDVAAAVSCAKPTVQASNLTIDALDNDGRVTLSLDNSPGNASLIIAKNGAPVDFVPVDGTAYIADPAFSQGPELGTGNYVIKQGTANSETVFQLPDGVTHFAAFTYNETSNCYVTDTPPTLVGPDYSARIDRVVNNTEISSVTTDEIVFAFDVTAGTGDMRITEIYMGSGGGDQINDWGDVLSDIWLTDANNNRHNLSDGGSLSVDQVIFNTMDISTIGLVPASTTKRYNLHMAISNSITEDIDKKLIEFNIFGFDVGLDKSSGSGFLQSTLQEGASGFRQIAVVATKINVTQQPSATANQLEALAQQPIFEATDVNGNLDLDFNEGITVGTVNPDDLRPMSAPSNFVSGLADFAGSGFNFQGVGTSTMFVTSGASSIASEDTNPIIVNGVTPTFTADNVDVTANTSCGSTGNGVIELTTVAPLPLTDYEFTLLNDKGVEVAQDGPRYEGLFAGDYTLSARNTISNLTSAGLAITVPDMTETPTFSEVNVPNSGCDNLTGSLTINVTSGFTPDYTFDWFEGSDTSTPLTNGTIANNAVNELPEGTYTVLVTNNSTSCFASGTYTILKTDPPPFTASLSGSGQGCPGEVSVTLSLTTEGTGGTGPFTAEIENLGEVIFESSDVVITTEESATYNLINVKDVNGCEANAVSGSAEAVVFSFPEVTINAPERGGFLSEIPFSFSSSDALTNVSWNFGDGSEGSLDFEPVHVYREAGIFIITLTAQSSQGCDVLATAQIFIPGAGSVIIRNAITPNGDGANDLLIIENIESFVNNTVTIYDRWGVEVVKFEDYDNTWDLTMSGGGLIPAGNYICLVELPDVDEVVKRTITVVRSKN